MNPPTLNVAMMTSGGLAPCLSSSIASLVSSYAELGQPITLRFYHSGYKGILTGTSTYFATVPSTGFDALHAFGGSPLGSSRVKLTNVADCLKRGYIKGAETPLSVAAAQLKVDNVDVLHTIGGDDTNTQAAELSFFLKEQGYGLTVVGMPKTIDNDVYPIAQTFGAETAAEEGAKFFSRVVSEGSSSPRMLIIHECMGRDSGFLTARSAFLYRESLKANNSFAQLPALPALSFGTRDVHAVYIPENHLDIDEEGARLKKVMDEFDVVNVFLSEGAGVEDIVKEMERKGEEVPRDAFGHIVLAKINPGAYLSDRLGKLVGAEKVLVQKSGYFARAAPSNDFDKELIQRCALEGAKSAIARVSGCMGEDENKGGEVRAIEFERIKGGKPFDVKQAWFVGMMSEVSVYGGAK